MRILLASSEVYPYSKTGGLADMVGALGKTLARAGHQVGLVTPLYAGIRERFPDLQPGEQKLDLLLGPQRVAGNLWSLEALPGFTIYFVDAPVFYERSGLYQNRGHDYPDNAERFIYFSKAIAHLAQHLAWKPEVVHLHDWQTGFAALFLYHLARAGQGVRPKVCMTIHNLAYQGLFPSGQYPLTNLPWEYFNPQGVEFYGRMSCLKAGLVFGDVITAVSPRYAREITSPEFGCGLDGLLRHRQDRLFGILNGVDYEEWNPGNDDKISSHYSAAGLENKAANKKQLQQEFQLPVAPDVPLFGSIGRLVEQKGVDIMLAALEQLLPSSKMQLVLLGTGSPESENAFQALAKKHPCQAAVCIGFDEALSHRIEAGCDFFLMPSRFEPCGLNQMYSLRYGTIPIVRATGGLDDTVVDIRENREKADGIKFHEYSAAALEKAIRKAIALFEEAPLLKLFRQNAMLADFSWERTASEYLKIYERAGKA